MALKNLKYIFFLVICLPAFNSNLVTAASGATALSRYDFDIQSGHYDYIDIEAKSKLTLSGQISGKMNITACNRHEKWGSGLRFQIKSVQEGLSINIGIICPQVGNHVEAEWMKSKKTGKSWDTIDGDYAVLHQVIGQEVQFSITLRSNIVILVVEGIRYDVSVDFNPETIELAAFGSTGYILITPPVG
ncbi:hypothetical protein [Robiginitomaculum antarcticum]|uniref:hypothetical protein n=1 Tax=Robiginitomaculum antarcticum TaxID=437507 RepID=UPI00035C6F56|nr:hypothetical protein [Robiginitomaculum antarcticum]